MFIRRLTFWLKMSVPILVSLVLSYDLGVCIFEHPKTRLLVSFRHEAMNLRLQRFSVNLALLRYHLLQLFGHLGRWNENLRFFLLKLLFKARQLEEHLDRLLLQR